MVTVTPPGEAIRKVQAGITSIYGDFQAEGLVGTPVAKILHYNDEHIITKLKTKNFTNATD